MIARLALVIGLLVAPSALAQDAGRPTATEIRNDVDRLLAAANASHLFENISTSTFGVARHKESGLTCVFSTGDPMNGVIVYPHTPNGPAVGDDVSCRAGLGGGTFVSVYATRYPQQPSEQALLDHAMSEVEQIWTDLEPLAEAIEIEVKTLHGNPLATGFIGTVEQRRLQSYVMVQNIGEWSFKGRVSGPLEDNYGMDVGVGVFNLSLPGNWQLWQDSRTAE